MVVVGVVVVVDVLVVVEVAEISKWLVVYSVSKIFHY